jgi:S-DNA-T family DNA segregation ATPase FtsK/SpoIIIE
LKNILSLTSPSKIFQKLEFARPKDAVAKEATMVLSIAIAAFIYLALFSHNLSDPSSYMVQIPAPEDVKNLAGTIGAELSAWLFYWIGYAAFLLPMFIFLNSYFAVKRERNLFRPLFIIFSIMSMISAASLLHNLLPNHFDASAQINMLSGGALGQTIFQTFSYATGKGGATLILIALVIVAFNFIFERSFYASLKNLGFSDLKTKFSKTKLLSPSVNFEPTINISKDAKVVEAAQKKSLSEESKFITVKTSEAASFQQVQKVTKKKIDLALFQHSEIKTRTDVKRYEGIATKIVKVLAEFGVNGSIVGYQPGPVVTVYEFQPAIGVKQSRILGMIDDLSLALKVESIFMHPVRGKSAIGIQVPNPEREMVFLGDLFSNTAFVERKNPLIVAMGKGVNGESVYADLAAMPHLLMAGATGSGKSMAINSILVNILYRTSPDQVKLLLVDPKMLELSVYDGIPHLLMPVITEPNKAAAALQWALSEMERRYNLMHHLAVRNLESFNQAWVALPESEKQKVREQVNDKNVDTLPVLVIVIDELADLMMTAPKEVEGVIQRLAQKARASGIHMVLATQRPSVDILTGVIKANLPCRIAFQVVSKHDSRTILDQMGAEKLLGKGDMLYMHPGAMRLERIQGPFVSDAEVQKLVVEIKQQYLTEYDQQLIQWIDEEMRRASGSEQGYSNSNDEMDEKFKEACIIAQNQGAISASYLQRQLKIGYNRAARIVEMMEEKGMVAKSDGVKPRKWLGIA